MKPFFLKNRRVNFVFICSRLGLRPHRRHNKHKAQKAHRSKRGVNEGCTRSSERLTTHKHALKQSLPSNPSLTVFYDDVADHKDRCQPIRLYKCALASHTRYDSFTIFLAQNKLFSFIDLSVGVLTCLHAPLSSPLESCSPPC